MPFYLNFLVNIIFLIIIINISFYILLILESFKKFKSFLYSIVSGYWVIIIKLYNFLI